VRVCSLVVLMLMCGGAAEAGVGEWKSYTAKRDVRDLVMDIDNSTLWVVTGGGMFSYRFSDSSYQQFTTSEGLKTIDLTAVAIDRTGVIWTGAQNGFLHRYNPANNEWRYVSDISLRSDPNKRINALRVVGDTLFILSDIGVSLFSISKMEFGDTYTRYGASPNQIVGNAMSVRLFQGKIWVGTRNGLASTPVTNTNPSAPESWQVFTTFQGMPSNSIRALSVISDSLYACTGGGLAVFRSPAWSLVPGTGGLNVVDITLNENPCNDCSTIYFFTDRDAWLYPPGPVSTPVPIVYPPSFITSVVSDKIIGTTSGVMIFDSMFVGRTYVPLGPPSNKFVGLAVDERGVVWSGTGISTSEGFMSFDGIRWKSYTSTLDSRLASGNFYKVSIGANNSKWVSSWGDGVALLDDAGAIQKVLNTTNGLSPSIDPSFVVVGGVATDENGVAWITDRTPHGDTAIVTFSPDSSFGYIRGLATRTPVRVLADVVIDQNGTKWFSNFSRFEGELPTGLYFFNERFALPGTINNWGKMTSADGLTTNKAYCLAVGRDGDLWIGSDEGISIIFNPGQPFAVAQYHPLRDQVIQSIVVDPLNNKWVATRQGVFVLSADGTAILDRYTVENTAGKLFDNDIASMAIDVHTGTMYFGTERGLSSLTTAGVEPNRSFGELTFTPNPMVIPSAVSTTIDGLIQNSLIKILSVDGNLVAEFRSPGGRIAFWDGKSNRGEYVSSGVYFVVAYSEDGTQAATGKVAVIRK